jgi:hypothetical protein
MPEFSSLNGYTVKDTTARNIAKGRNQAVAFSDYASMIEALNAMEKDQYKTGQNIYIGVVGVPDLWVYSVENIVHNFSYVSDDDVVEKLTANTTIQAGYYKLAMLEGQKVDLTTVNERLDDIETSFRDGCNTLVSKCTALGTTPSSNSPADISNAMDTIATNKYNAGKKAAAISTSGILKTDKKSVQGESGSSVSLSYTAEKDCYVCAVATIYQHNSWGNGTLTVSGGTQLSSVESNSYGERTKNVLVKLNKGSKITVTANTAANPYSNRAVSYIAFKIS